MNEENRKARSKLKEVETVKEYDDIISSVVLSGTEKEILRLHYVEQKDMRYIADEIGMAEITVVKKHAKILKKIAKVL